MNIKNYFSFTRGEKKGIIVFFVIIIALIVANFSVDFFKKNTHTDFSEFEESINKFEQTINSKEKKISKKEFTTELFNFNPNTISEKEWLKLGFKKWQIKTLNNYKAKGGNWKTKNDVSKIYGLEESHFKQLKPFILLPEKLNKEKNTDPEKKVKQIEYFEFNPNTISKEEWTKLGFKDWQIKTILNYKSSGGSWITKADVKKIYGLSETDYSNLKAFILLPETVDKKEYPTNKKDYNKIIDVNKADAKELTNLKGIYSEKYAKIIIKHRDQLGGFNSKEQLKDVWNMTPETYNGFIQQVKIGKYEPKKININNSSTQQLKTHPYIDWKTANAIYKYREANGNYKKIEDIKNIHLINKKTYLKIAPYLIIK